MINQPVKTCLVCAKPLKGRSDKKFCDAFCRTSYNNEQNSLTNNYSRNIIHTLQRNKRILQEFLGNQVSTYISQDLLLLKGFHFQFHTHTVALKKGQVYTFCFDTGYTLMENEKIHVIKREKL